MPTRAKIIIGDSRRMAEVADEDIDLVVTSPPTGISRITAAPGRPASVKASMPT